MFLSTRRIIEVTCSGWGALVGGLMIGITELGDNSKVRWCEYVYETAFQQGITGRRKGWAVVQMKVCNLIYFGMGLHLLTPFNVTIRLSPHWIFTLTDMKLREAKWIVDNVKVTDETQDYVDFMFRRELAKIDIELAKIGPPGANTFFGQLNWVAEDLKNREQYVKTGWKTWKSKWKKRIQIGERVDKHE